MEAGPQSSAARPVTAMGSELAALTEEKRQPHMEAVVMRVVREVTGDENVGSGTPLMEAGVDSLAATELANRLRATTELPVSPTLMFDFPTPRAIAAHILEQLVVQVQQPALPEGSQVVREGTVVIELGRALGRWPGGCSTDGQLWAMVHECGDAVGAVPSQRWTLEQVVDTMARAFTS